MFGKKEQLTGKQMLVTTEYKRLPGHLYYVGTDDKGNICIMQTVMQRGSKKKQTEMKQ